MPGRAKRAGDFDPTKSDSDDEDYDAASSRPSRTKPSKLQRGARPPKKKRKKSYDDDDEGEEVSDEGEPSDDSFEIKDEPEPEVDPRTGRPVRAARKARVTYEESDEEEEIEDPEPSPEPRPQRQSTTPKKKTERKTQILKLKLPKPTAEAGPLRSTRARSMSGKKPPTADAHPQGTRRSSRINNDDTETIIALTDSGRHADIVHRGTRSPEPLVQRAIKGGKGLKKPPASKAIVEEAEESSGHTKTEEMDEPRGAEYPQISPEPMQDVATSGKDLGKASGAREEAAVDEDHVANDDEEEQVDADVMVPESQDNSNKAAAAEEDEDHDDEPIATRSRRNNKRKFEEDHESPAGPAAKRTRGLTRASAARPTKNAQKGKKGPDDTSDFEPGNEEDAEENVSDSDSHKGSPHKDQENEESSSSNNRRSARNINKARAATQKRKASDASEVADELAEELEELQSGRAKRIRRQEILYDDKPQTRKRKPVDYRILRPDIPLAMDDDDNVGPSVTPSKKARAGGGGTYGRSLFSTYGPFGGGGGPPPVLGGAVAAGGADSDSSDDENMRRPQNAPPTGGLVGMTPTSGAPPNFGLYTPAQTNDPSAQTGLVKRKQKAALTDADPLGTDVNVNFDSVGGLQGHIDKLKEMVALPLLYPEVFQRYKITPPRGVLFHGPPGTGKTLLARALASSVSSEGKKVTFYMRKGADALSKWVGEAEKSLRLLFEEARKTQPSIIFFDEIDGLAPVRSSKQEQIHASIVSTLLALMDGMDGRGQVIVIGATNRPDSIDPALRRPGRFDREFYFPLPNTEGRRAILDIHTKGWEPPVPSELKDELADLTKGYGGADLRALCTEAALNAVQRRYPQIYKSNEKLQIDPQTINITAKDFMISVKKIIPSSERSVSSGAAPLPRGVEPLLRQALVEIKNEIAQALPQKKPLTALEEAMYEDAEGDKGIKVERMQQEFERSRIFRPRLLISGEPGMGQGYLAAALLNHFEGLHVQSFDLATIMSDSTRSPEATVVQLFTEVRRHKPSVVYIPNVDVWWNAVGPSVISVFRGLLKSLAPTEPVLLLGVFEGVEAELDRELVSTFFGYSKRNHYSILKPARECRRDFFQPIMDSLRTSPDDFPDPADRKLRVLEQLLPVPPEKEKTPPPPSKEELKAQKRKDRLNLNILKQRIQPIMDLIKNRHKKFRLGVIDENQIRYLFEEENPDILTSDLPQPRAAFRPFERSTDGNGHPGLVEQASGKFFYNLETVTIEKRLSNGYYKRPKDFLADIKKLGKDAYAMGDQDRILKANELRNNVEVDMAGIELDSAYLTAEWEAIWQRENKRQNDAIEKEKQRAAADGRELQVVQSNVPPPIKDGASTEQSTGPITLGEPLLNGAGRRFPITPITAFPHPSSHPSSSLHTNGYSAEVSDLSNLHRQSNGTSGTSPSQAPHDTHLSTSQEIPSTERETQGSSFGPSAQERPLHSATGAPSSLAQRSQYHPNSLSQKSAVTPMAEGSNPQMYQNYASTTSSSNRRKTGSSADKDVNTPSQNERQNAYAAAAQLLDPRLGGATGAGAGAGAGAGVVGYPHSSAAQEAPNFGGLPGDPRLHSMMPATQDSLYNLGPNLASQATQDIMNLNYETAGPGALHTAPPTTANSSPFPPGTAAATRPFQTQQGLLREHAQHQQQLHREHAQHQQSPSQQHGQGQGQGQGPAPGVDGSPPSQPLLHSSQSVGRGPPSSGHSVSLHLQNTPPVPTFPKNAPPPPPPVPRGASDIRSLLNNEPATGPSPFTASTNAVRAGDGTRAPPNTAVAGAAAAAPSQGLGATSTTGGSGGVGKVGGPVAGSTALATIPPHPTTTTTTTSLPPATTALPLTTATKTLTVDAAQTVAFHDQLVRRTNACSVEQLEQVYSAIMGEVWRTRGQWDRRVVVEGCGAVLEDVLVDIEGCQGWGVGASFE